MKIVLCEHNHPRARALLTLLAASVGSGCKIMDCREFMDELANASSDFSESPPIDSSDIIVVPMCTKEEIDELIELVDRLSEDDSPRVVKIGEEGEEVLREGSEDKPADWSEDFS